MTMPRFDFKIGFYILISICFLDGYTATYILADDIRPTRNPLVENYDETGRKLPSGVPKYVDTNGVLLSINHHFTTPQYQQEAIRLMMLEANAAAKELGLPEHLPIVQSDIGEFHVSPFEFAYGHKMIGFVATKNYTYYVACDNKLNHVDIDNYDSVCVQLKNRRQFPISKLDTNKAFCLATNWLARLSIDVVGLNRDCVPHVAVSPSWNNLLNLGDTPQHRLVPIYYVWWTYPGDPLQGQGGAASVELYAPTKKLLQLNVEDAKYILRKPVEFTNMAALFPGVAPIHTNLPAKPLILDHMNWGPD